MFHRLFLENALFFYEGDAHSHQILKVHRCDMPFLFENFPKGG